MGFFKNPSILPRDRERARGEMCLHVLFFLSTGQKKMLDFYSMRNLDTMLLGQRTAGPFPAPYLLGKHSSADPGQPPALPGPRAGRPETLSRTGLEFSWV